MQNSHFSPSFPSPNSELPPELLARQERCIEEANDFLLTIGAPREPQEPDQEPNTRSLQRRLRKLRGLQAQIRVAHRQPATVVGTIVEAGRDFLHLEQNGRRLFVPFRRIAELKRTAEPPCDERQPELLCLDDSSRRSLVLCFGSTVAGDPQLINLFFGIPLWLQTLEFAGCEVQVKTDDPAPLSQVKGRLAGADEHALHVQAQKKMIQIPWEKIGTVTLPEPGR